MKVKIKLTALLLTAGVFSAVLAQQPQMNFKVVGKVVEKETNNLLEYVNVVIFNTRDSSMVSGSITGKDGSFSLDVNHPGKLYLVADFIGYHKTIISDILLKPGNFVYDAGTITIRPEVVGIEQVDVVADRPYVSYQIDKKVVEVALNPSAQGGTAVDALQNVPSVQTDIEGNVSIRGNSNFTVLIDGRQSPLSGSDALKQIPANAIDKIEIITNPSVKYDPDGTAGIVNIISKKGKLNGHSAIINLSTGNNLSGGKTPMYSGDINYSYRFNKFTVNTGISYRNSKNKIYSLSDKNNSNSANWAKDSVKNLYEKGQGNMNMHNFTARAGIDYQISKSNTFSIGGEYSDFGFNRGEKTDITTTYFNNEKDYVKSYSGSSSNPNTWQLKLGDRTVFKDNPEHYLNIDFIGQKTRDFNEDTVSKYIADENMYLIRRAGTFLMSNIHSQNSRYRLELSYANPISKQLSIEAGYSLRVDISNMQFSLSDKFLDSQDWIINEASYDSAKLSRYINAGWLIAKGEIKTIQYSVGLRAEMTNQLITTQKDQNRFSYDSLVWYPSFSLSKEFSGGHQLQASYSRRVNRPWDRALTPFPTISNGYNIFVPNPNLRPENAGSFEINYQKSWGQSFISLETFYRKTDNKLERMHDPLSSTVNVFTMKNMGYDKSIGGEAMANVKVAPWFIINSSTSVYYYEEKGTSIDSIAKTVNNTNWELSLTCNFTLPTKTRIQMSGQYEGPQKEIGSDEESVYWISASVKQDFFDRKLSATLRIDDILNSRKHKERTYSEYLNSYGERYRKSPMFVFSLSYRFNQQNGDKKRNGREDVNGGEGGMDMEY
jgi:outer membrane receptor protein involved in Fe transport